MNGENYLAPRLIALAKDSALSLCLDQWQTDDSLVTYKDVIDIFDNNDIDRFEKTNIIIKEKFKNFSLPEISSMIKEAYLMSESVIKDTLRFVGRPNSGSETEIFKWGHSHSH